jgi:predicted nicotinamide N-methyase
MGRVLQVQVPEGAEPGDMLSFVIDGQELEIPMPDGFAAGDTLEIELDSTDAAGEAEVEVEPEDGADDDASGHDERVPFVFGPITVYLKEDGVASSRSHFDGTGGYVWRSAKALGEFVAHQPTAVRGLRVMELGSGSGAVGIVAALCGAASVALTDKAELMPLLAHNIDANSGRFACELSACALEWGATATDVVDVVLGSDLLYSGDERLFGALVHTIESTSAATVWLCVHWRKPDVERRFFELMEPNFDARLEWPIGTPSWREYGRADSVESTRHFAQLMRVGDELVALGSLTEADVGRLTKDQYSRWEEAAVQIFKFTRRDVHSAHAKKQRVT